MKTCFRGQRFLLVNYNSTFSGVAMIDPERRMLMSGLSRGSEMPKDHKSRVLDAALENENENLFKIMKERLVGLGWDLTKREEINQERPCRRETKIRPGPRFHQMDRPL